MKKHRTYKQALGAKAYYAGKIAEYIAIVYLLLKGYRLLAHHQRTPFAELDLIVKRGKMIILVEVKHRISLDDAVFSLQPAQLGRLEKGFSWWLAQHHLADQGVIRMDLLAVGFYRLPRHIKNISMMNYNA